jgi:hypothetical protein
VAFLEEKATRQSCFPYNNWRTAITGKPDMTLLGTDKFILYRVACFMQVIGVTSALRKKGTR